eukprot:TRINITY_DN10810_c3_g1_i1.p1 TRINITY_DN10810_c3_g1~~TRINITY_DN10810_c3_g1_i1.p1  ORF type:complete len:189 (+),score=70.26 TRINITY_DN10810_c3_g1_i1:159-725(+)
MCEYKIVVAGSGSVGKSALTISYIQHTFVDEYDPTIEDSYRKQVQIGNEVCVLDILDTAGQDEYICMRDSYYIQGQAFLVVFSLASYSSFCEVDSFIEHIQRIKDSDNVPIVLVGNKSDLVSERQVTAEAFKEKAEKYNVPFIETSAAVRKNVDEAFAKSVEEVRRIRNINNKDNKKKNKKKPQCVLF